MKLHDIAVREAHFIDFFAVDERAVGSAHVLQEQFVADRGQLGMAT
jgi:hypothetical protein